jgi:signal transduction histidine kinase
MSEQGPSRGDELFVREMDFSAAELEGRKRFLQFDAADERRLLQYGAMTRDRAGQIVDALYDHLLSFDETRAFFSGPEEIDRVKRAEVRYFERLTQGSYGPEYAEERLKIGAMHERVGLDVKYYLGAYCFYLREIARPLSSSQLAPAERLAIYQSFLKLVFLDIGLAFDTYVFRRERELKTAIHETEAFNYSVSHDLRAPLRAIIGFSEALMEDAGERLDEESRSHVTFIVQGARRMAQLIEDLLKLSRLSRAEMQLQALCLSDLAADVAGPLLAADGRAVDLRIQRGIWATGDPRLLTVVLENLLGNAFKFTSRHPAARVDVGVRREGSGLVAYVRDDGVGFDMANADRLFGAFQRLHTEAEFEGTGIGLATVMRIVRRHGGRVWAESRPEQGATFYLTLPDLRQE